MNYCDKKEDGNEIDSSNLEGLICYCFKHSKRELFEAIQVGKEQEIIDDIKTKIKDPGCFCKTANPSGKCCLPDISNFIKANKNL